MNILKEIQKLNFPSSDFIIVGSGILDVKKIRDSQDIDLLVNNTMFQTLKKEGWKFEIINGKEVVSYDIFEAFTEFNNIPFENFIKNKHWVEKIDGFYFNSLPKLLSIKKEWEREKDIRDVQLITQYLESRLKQKYPFVYQWTDKPHTVYKKHSHKGSVSFYVLSGGLSMTFPDKTIELSVGDYIDVPIKIEHTAVIGANGCTYLVGQELEDDT